MAINWIEIYKKYKGNWIALDRDETTVVAAAKDARKAYAEAKKKGLEVPIMFNVPLKVDGHVGSF